MIDYKLQMENEETQAWKLEVPPPSLENVATLAYTSGTTGAPKGAMITNKNIICTCAAVSAMSIEMPDLQDNVSLLYLPLAHVMGRVGLYHGYYIANSFGIFGGDYTKLMDDIQALKPTQFTAVPRILVRIYDGIMSKMTQAGFVKRAIFNKALNSKLKGLRTKGELKSGFYDKVIFSKIQQLLGGRVQRLSTGSAAIAPEVLEFFRVAFGCDVLEGYGQT